MAVQHHVDIFWNVVRRNVNEMEPDAVSFQIEPQWPLKIAVAIAAHNTDGRTERFERLQDARRANIPEVPNLVGARSQRLDFRGQFIVRVGENKDLQARRHCLIFAVGSSEGRASARPML